MCRTKRNITDYDRTGEISEHEANELLQEVKNFKQEVEDWLRLHWTSWRFVSIIVSSDFLYWGLIQQKLSFCQLAKTVYLVKTGWQAGGVGIQDSTSVLEADLGEE